MAEPLRLTTALLATAASFCLIGQWAQPVTDRENQVPVVVEDRLEPTDFSPEELKLLQRRFGVHGPQTQLAQLFTNGVDQLKPLRSQTLDRLRELKPVILRESAAHRVNPMLITAVLFDEIQHSKPGESLPFIAHSGLVKTHGPAQIGISELIHQKRLPENPTQEEITWARKQLLDPEMNITFLAAKFQRLKLALGLPESLMLQASRSYLDAKTIATLTYLHNGKLDYPVRVMGYMQDPELHGLIYCGRQSNPDITV
ncbi:helicase DnaB [Synechococcus sp. HB1133]|uniref:helicase DnaB n=1 Tax=unclassified Synechococcus TaxID=2626047 RepID=UPI00140AE386|nr:MULTISPECIES: helicase DnaB [unclassified Synechococcus]MCB4394995.1 helicase DnaB [Synechococcus sp. PH41509]MCB4421895.1 helicase DnaB [Synechococcus sp. HB1133]MCB4430158.1 helicase DnaB [Synechococcus sp. HBA1120]NHI80837.1 helicase DnaB [Synechococcus sp. HB1133]